MKRKKAYFVGIKGVGMTSLAIYLSQKGYQVEGSDVATQFSTDSVLAKYKIPIKVGFSKKNINKKYDLVVVTGGHDGMKNPEAQWAKELGFKTMMHGQALGELMKGKVGISVAGCHGKTTTAALVASLLTHAGLKPSYAIGTSQINDLGPAGHFGKGKYLIAEADEYVTCPETDSTPRFLWQNPKYIILTNIDYDHPDVFANLDEVISVYKKFVNNLPPNGILIACRDDKNVAKILPSVGRPIITYGFSPAADYRIRKVYYGDNLSFMKIDYHNVELGEYMIKIPGRSNLLNALAASIVGHSIGISWMEIAQYLKRFTGTRRRFEKVGQYSGVSLYDDYAHHPNEIASTISAFRSWFPDRRLVVIFQPHTFSRTKALLSDFAKSLIKADIAIVVDIFPSAREEFDSSISSKILVAEASKYNKNVIYKEDKKQVLSYLADITSFNDLVVTMGAGDIYTWKEDITEVLKNQ